MLFRRNWLLLVALSGLCGGLEAQTLLRGQVLEADTREPMPFARVQALHARMGTSTDLDGRFRLTDVPASDTIEILFLSYQPLRVPAASFLADTALTLLMQADTVAIETVEILPGENPAHRIVRNAVANRDINDPHHLPAFSYYSYNKLKSGFDFPVEANTIRDPFISRSDLFLWESVTQRIFKAPGRSRETVLASKMSGLQTLALPFTSTEVQSLSFYRNWVQILGTDFLSPLASNSIDRYYFYLEDTLYDGPDSIFVLRFKPRQAGYNGFVGLIGIHSKRWAIQSLEAKLRATDENAILKESNIRQVHARINDTLWFPQQLSAQLLLGNTIRPDTSGIKRTGQLYMSIRSDLTGLRLDTSFTNHAFSNVSVEVDPQVLKRGEQYLTLFRTDSLTQREETTYQVIDSISKAEKLEEKLHGAMTLMNGRLPFHEFNIILGRVFSYNRVEHARWGAGVETSDLISRKFTLGGWGGFGRQDARWKYGASADFHPFFAPFWRLRLQYDNDLVESGLNDMALSPNLLLHEKTETERDSRYLFVSRMHYVQRWQGAVFLPSLFRNVQHRVALRAEQIDPAYNYLYFPNEQSGTLGPGSTRFHTTELVADARWAPGERFMRTLQGMISQGSKWPVFAFRYTQAFRGLWGGQYSYHKYEAAASRQAKLPGAGTLFAQATAGLLQGNIPYPKLYTYRANGAPSWVSQNTAFNLMPFNTFAANRYATLQASFTVLNKTFPSVNFTPSLTLSAGAAWGQYVDKEAGDASRHQGITFTAPNKGYYEAGFNLTNLLPKNAPKRWRSLKYYGFGMYYRFGPYQVGTPEKNICFKFAFSFPLSLGEF